MNRESEEMKLMRQRVKKQLKVDLADHYVLIKVSAITLR